MYVGKNTVTFRVALPEGTVGPEYIGNDGKATVLANAVSGAMDLVTAEESQTCERIALDEQPGELSPVIVQNLKERGFVYEDLLHEQQAYGAIVDGYFSTIRSAPMQFMFIPSFLCQLACPYCFEGELTGKSPRMTDEMIDAAFDVIPALQEAHDNAGQPYITLFGGEPLLDVPDQRRAIERILRNAHERNYPVTAVTNGVQLAAYAPLLKRYGCEEVQVSLDGTPEIHDTRRVFRGGKPTFHLIEEGIDAALREGIRIYLRVLVDRDTYKSLPAFAEFAKRKGWIGNPDVTIFHGFTKRTAFLYVTPDHPQEVRAEMVKGDVTMNLQEEFYAMLRQHPLVDEMFRPDPARIRHAILEGDVVRPNLQGCSAGTSVLAFDPNGHIYGCPETVGREHHSCGAYFPVFTYNNGYRDPWRHRYVDTVPMCKECNVKLFCGGGGCPIKGWAFSGGDFNEAYCPKVETVKAQVEHALEYLIPMALQGSHNRELREGTTAWDKMKEVGSFPWMS